MTLAVMNAIYAIALKPEKSRTSMGFELAISQYQCDALTNWSFVGSNEPVRNEYAVMYEIFHILHCGCQIK